jgi:hypothetical protein
MTIRHITGLMIAALAALSACGSDRGLHRLNAGQAGPDEFSVLPSLPLDIPATLDLPQPTLGGLNRADRAPVAEAVAALGGNALAGPPGDAALIASVSRNGMDPSIRATLAGEDAAFRRRAGAGQIFNFLGNDRYYQAYARQALDAYAELTRFRNLGVQVPSAPPPT